MVAAMTLSPELLAMIKDVKPASDAYVEGLRRGLSADDVQSNNPEFAKIILSLIARIAAPVAPLSREDVVQEEVYEAAWIAFRDSDKPAIYNQVKDAVNAALVAAPVQEPAVWVAHGQGRNTKYYPAPLEGKDRQDLMDRGYTLTPLYGDFKP